MTPSDSAVSIEEKLSRTSHAERLSGARNLVKGYVLASTGIALVPLPLADLVGVMALQIKLVHGLAKHYDVPFKESIAQSLIASLLSGASSILFVKVLGSFAKAIPLLGTLGGLVAVTSASVTYAIGEVFIKHFESGGSLLDIDIGKAKALFKRELDNGHATGITTVDTPTQSAVDTAAKTVAEIPAEQAPVEWKAPTAQPVASGGGKHRHTRVPGMERLEDIVGIGEVYANRLRAAGIGSFAELSALSVERIKEIIGRGFPQSVEAIQSWIKQADDLAKGDL